MSQKGDMRFNYENNVLTAFFDITDNALNVRFIPDNDDFLGQVHLFSPHCYTNEDLKLDTIKIIFIGALIPVLSFVILALKLCGELRLKTEAKHPSLRQKMAQRCYFRKIKSRRKIRDRILFRKHLKNVISLLEESKNLSKDAASHN